MKIGFVGLGNLGFPIATTIQSRGHEVTGFDTNPTRMSVDRVHHVLEHGPDGEPFADFQAHNPIKYGDLTTIVVQSDIIFVCVPTPHAPQYEGISPIPSDRKNFDFSILYDCLASLAQLVADTHRNEKPVIAVISTVLPGTTRHILDKLSARLTLSNFAYLVYNPSFCAMGNTPQDFLNPEFVLLGADDPDACPGVTLLESFYRTLTRAPIRSMSIGSAELTKVAYNLFITAKITMVNVIGDICSKVEADVDDVTDALCYATRRLISPAYMRAGLGDGGACHPRDAIAMSWLAEELGIHHNIFESFMQARDTHARSLAARIYHRWRIFDGIGPVLMLGYAYKPQSNLTAGSHALLIAHYLREKFKLQVVLHDPYVSGFFDVPVPTCKVVFIGCNHKEFKDLTFAAGTCVIDPFGDLPFRGEIVRDQPGRRKRT